MEKRVYIISCDELWEFIENKYGSIEVNYDSVEMAFESVSDDDYKSAVKQYGWTLDLNDFVNEFNRDSDLAPTTQYHYIRIY